MRTRSLSFLLAPATAVMGRLRYPQKFALISFFLVQGLVRETKGKELEEMEG